MRIISGKLKGRRLRAPKNLPVRPTTDMAKEALFNIINNLYYFDSITVIDLFSGQEILVMNLPLEALKIYTQLMPITIVSNTFLIQQKN